MASKLATSVHRCRLIIASRLLCSRDETGEQELDTFAIELNKSPSRSFWSSHCVVWDFIYNKIIYIIIYYMYRMSWCGAMTEWCAGPWVLDSRFDQILPFRPVFRIRIHFGRLDPDPDLGGPKWTTKVKKIQVLNCKMFSFEGWRFLL